MTKKRFENRKGSVLVVTLWILVVLTILAVSLGRNVRSEIKATKVALAKMRAQNYAWAGLLQAIDQLRQDTLVPTEFDGKIGQGSFKGSIQSEDARINLNAFTLENIRILDELLELLGIDHDSAKTAARSILDWKDEDGQLSDKDFGAENEYYLALKNPYRVKNYPLESFEELLLVRGVTPELLAQLKNVSTIYPIVGGGVKVDFALAPEIVLKALAYSLTGPATNTTREDADSLVRTMMSYRESFKDKEGARIDFDKMMLNAREKVIYLTMKQYQTSASNYFRVTVQASSEHSLVNVRIGAIIRREDLSILAWRQE